MSLFSRLAKYDTFRSFKHRNYRLFYAGNLLSNTGSWIQRVAQDWLTLELTHSGTALGVVTALQFGPAILFSLHGGRLADRFSKRHLIIWTNLVSAATAAVIGMLVLTDTITINWLYLLALVSGIAGAIQAPIWQTFVHDLVGADDLPNAIALNSTNFNIGRLIGPAISGYLISILGTGPSFLLNAASFAFSITALAVMREHELFAALRPDADADGSIRAGLRYLRTRPDVITVLILIAMSGTFGLNYQMFMALMAKHEFNRAADSFGLLGSVMAIGSVSGALYVARRTERPTGQETVTITSFSDSKLTLPETCTSIVGQTLAPGAWIDCVLAHQWIVPAATGQFVNTATATGCDDDSSCDTDTGTATVKFSWYGRTPGYWKNHPAAWPTPYLPTQLLNTVFTLPSGITSPSVAALAEGAREGGLAF